MSLPNPLDLQGLLNKVYDPTLQALRIRSLFEVLSFGPDDFSGGLAITTVNSVDYLNFPDSATSTARVQFFVPPFWTLLSVDLIWANLGTGTGNVRWRTAMKDLADGNNNSEAFVSDVTANIAAQAQNITEFSDGRISNLACGNDRLFSLTVERIGADAGDSITPASTAGLAAVRVRAVG